MLVPFSVSDFINRAAQVYGDRVGVIDEPDQPAPSLGSLTYAEIKALAVRQAARLDELGIGFGDRVAIVSQNSARLLTSFFGVAGHGRVLVPVNFRLRPDEVRYIVEHSGARVLILDPELDESLADERGVQVRDRSRRRPLRGPGGGARGMDPGRERHRVHQLHLGHHRTTQGRPDHAPQRVDQRGDLRPARRHQ
jgi:acyl-CoA synthetase (AMP-forming)/AMP-acid ligase II